MRDTIEDETMCPLHLALSHSLCRRLFDVRGRKKPCTCGEHERVMVVERGRCEEEEEVEEGERGGLQGCERPPTYLSVSPP